MTVRGADRAWRRHCPAPAPLLSAPFVSATWIKVAGNRDRQGRTMADQADSNGTMANGADTLPQIGLITQYVKDLSFENPNAPGIYQQPAQPQIDVQFHISVAPVAD